MSTTYAKRGQRKRIFAVLMAMTFFIAALTGCTHKSQVEDQSKSEPDSASVAAQDTEVSIDDGTQQEPDTTSEVLDTTIFIDEKLNENLFIKAELKMPEATLYEYSTQLKTFDLEKAQEAIQQNGEGTIASDIGGLSYQRNDMSSHLDTYCSFAGEQGLANDKELSFMSQKDAITRVQNLIDQLEIGGQLGTPEVVAMNQADFENVKSAILTDDYYKNILPSKGYGNDVFDENLEAYRMEFGMEMNGIPLYGHDDPPVRSGGGIMAFQVSVTVLLSNNGIEKVDIIGALEPFENQQKQADIISAEGIKDALMAEYGDVILSEEYRAENIWMEYFPSRSEGSIEDVALVPVWCVDFAIGGNTVEDSQYTLRFHAVTGELVS